MRNLCFKLPEDLRPLLSKPLGVLIEGPPEYTMSNLRRIISELNPPKIITVGDIVTFNAVHSGIDVGLGIIDRKSLRKKIALPHEILKAFSHVFVASNPPGMITCEAIRYIREAIRIDDPTLIVIDGEEDLLVIPSILESSTNSIIVYGQPYRGIVLITITEEIRENYKQIMRKFIVIPCRNPIKIF